MASLVRLGTASIAVPAISALLCLLVVLGPASASAATPTISVSPTQGPVGTMMTITGTGYPANTNIQLGWSTENASWLVQAIPTPQTTGVTETHVEYKLNTTVTSASGSFSIKMPAPVDYGGNHPIQVYLTNGTGIGGTANFRITPRFSFSPASGPAGTAIQVIGTGLGLSTYSTDYCVYWDNNYVGYASAVSTGGVANFTLYATGTPGIHYVTITEGNNGPGYLNQQQAPPSPGYYDPPYVPYYANFTVTPQNVVPALTSASTDAALSAGAPGVALLAILAGSLVAGSLFVSTRKPEERKALAKSMAAVIIILLIAVAGLGLYAATAQNKTTSTVTVTASASTTATSSSSSGPEVVYTPVATVVRPHITVSVPTVTSGPRITVTPTIASVGQSITVSGQGFAPNAQLPIGMTTLTGSNLVGYKNVIQPLRNVTAGADGSFSFTMKTPYTLGGTHYIAAGNLTEHSNGTLFVQRTAFISATQGPTGTNVTVTMYGVGWTYNTNIVAFDYDNNYLGYACGFESGGNVTVYIRATGPPGIHTIDLYPSVWFGPVLNGTVMPGDGQQVDYDNPLLTPQDHPNLMPSFHFTFLVTSSSSGTQSQGLASSGGFALLGSAQFFGAGAVLLLVLVSPALPGFRAVANRAVIRY